jgi:hypothetical protein
LVNGATPQYRMARARVWTRLRADAPEKAQRVVREDRALLVGAASIQGDDMNDKPYYTALLDTCLFRIAPAQEVVFESRDGSIPSLRGPQNSVAQLVKRDLPKKIPDNERWKRAQSEGMPRIAELARQGRVRLFTYDEIENENLRGAMFPSGVVAHCLAGVEIGYVPAAIERSIFPDMPLESFCRGLRSLDHRELAKRTKFLSKFSDFERRNLKSLGRFVELCAGLEETHHPDALHLWTAEVNNLDFFLTSDKKFINVMTMTSQVALTTRPICPSDLLSMLEPRA